LLKAREEAEAVVDGADALSPEQKRLLHEYIGGVLDLILDQKRVPVVGMKGSD
jgi:hypothetical protein